MYVEIPVCRRCCCLPLRYGIIIFGYLHLVISVLMLSLESVTLSKSENGDVTRKVVAVYNGVGFVVQSWVAFVLYGIDLVCSVLLLIGAHKKDVRLLKVYYYFGIATTIASFVMFIIMRFEVYEMENFMYFHILIVETCLAVTVIGIKIGLLLLIRSEVMKLKQEAELRFSNPVREEFIDVAIEENNPI